jgi:hypothetical protein
MPAPKEPLEDGLYSKFHSLLPWQFALRFSGSLLHAHVGLLGLRKIPLRSERFRGITGLLIAGRNQPWQSCFDHAAPSECSMRASPTVSAVGSITIL